MNFYCTAILVGGGAVRLDKALSFSFEADYFNVADHFDAVFTVDQEYGVFTYINAFINDRCFFSGMVDDQKNIVSKEGVLFQVSCTSIHARLTQNQVHPMELFSIDTNYIIQHYIQPYGISTIDFNEVGCSYMNLTLGMTAWKVVDLFSRMMYNTIPHFNRDGYLSRNPFSAYTARIGNQGDGVPYLYFNTGDDSSRILSSVHAKASDDKYDYSYVVNNPMASVYQTQRERYYKPLECWDYVPGMGVSEILRDSNAKSKTFEVMLPQIADIYPSDQIIVTDRPDLPAPLYAGHVKWTADPNGCFTQALIYDGTRI